MIKSLMIQNYVFRLEGVGTTSYTCKALPISPACKMQHIESVENVCSQCSLIVKENIT